MLGPRNKSNVRAIHEDGLRQSVNRVSKMNSYALFVCAIVVQKTFIRTNRSDALRRLIMVGLADAETAVSFNWFIVLR